MWIKNQAIIVGTDHIHTKTNRQDYVLTYSDRDITCGVVCDGCSSGQFSEFGACFIANLVIKLLKTNREATAELLTVEMMIEIKRAIDSVLFLLHDYSTTLPIDIAHFIEHHFLSTFVFCMIAGDRIIIGRCGDGLTIVNGIADIADQKNAPHYIAYNNVPKFLLSTSDLNGIEIQVLNEVEVNSIVIGTDGLVPLLEANEGHELFGTEKRQLQRKFNVWQNKRQLFHDDVSCVVFEKVKNEDSIMRAND